MIFLLRCALLLAVVASLAACGRDDAQSPAQSSIPAELPPRAWPPLGWAWSQVRAPGAPALRYGVSSPSTPPLGHLVIVPDQGESAELYFETARDLNAEGLVVWVLDSAGSPRARGFEGRAAALTTLIQDVVRPSPGGLTLAAHGDGALPALLALQRGTRGIDRLFLWSPTLETPAQGHAAAWMSRIGLGGMQAFGSVRSPPAGDPARDEIVRQAWSRTNPHGQDDRVTWNEIASAGRLTRAFTRPDQLARVRIPVAIRGPSDGFCERLAVCAYVRTDGRPEHLAVDGRREAWLDALIRFALPQAHGR